MEGLSRYLKKFKVIVGDKSEEKRIVQVILKSTVNLNVSLEQIRIEKSAVLVSLSPLERGELLMHKKEVLESIKQKGIKITELR